MDSACIPGGMKKKESEYDGGLYIRPCIDLIVADCDLDTVEAFFKDTSSCSEELRSISFYFKELYIKYTLFELLDKYYDQQYLYYYV